MNPHEYRTLSINVHRERDWEVIDLWNEVKKRAREDGISMKEAVKKALKLYLERTNGNNTECSN